MFRWWEVGFVAVGLGIVLGGAAVGWLYMRRDDGSEVAAPASSRGPVLGDSTGSGDPLMVTTNGTQGLSGGQSLSGGNGSSASSVSSGGSGNGSDQLPTPGQFGVYDQYKNNPVALYIDVKPGG